MRSLLWQAHLERVRLNTELRNARRRIAALNARPRCIYCGNHTRRLSGACDAHSDLPALDAGYRIHAPTKEAA